MTTSLRELQPVVAHVPGFVHQHAAHCESGVTRTLLREAGLELSEPMVFGLGASIFFAYLPFVRVMGHPLTTFRSFPGSLFRTATKRLGVKTIRETFRDPKAGMRRLDELLAQGRRVGLQTNIYWLPYIPRQLRIHFNGHNLVVLEKRGDTYIVSDPVVEDLFECPADALERARFSGGARILGRGRLYTIESVPDAPDLADAIHRGVRDVSNRMMRIPRLLPWFGIKGVAHLAKDIRRWPARLGERRARQWAASVVRMQEEIGTGGAGFRYIFAAFLQESAELLGREDLAQMSVRATTAGDAWRRWALHAARIARGKPGVTWEQLADGLAPVTEAERGLFGGV